MRILALATLSIARKDLMKLKALLFAFLLPVPLHAQGVRYDSNVFTAASNVPAGAQAPMYTLPYSIVSVCSSPAVGTPCTNLVTIYQDQAMTIPLTQPITADAQGRFGYWIPAGTYTQSVQSPAGVYLGTTPITFGGSGYFSGNSAVSVSGTPQPGQSLFATTSSAAVFNYPASNLGNFGRVYYHQSFWPNLAAFTQVGSQFSTVNNQITMSGATGSFATNYISLNGSNNNDQEVDFEVTFQVNGSQPGGAFCTFGSSNYGIAIGKLGSSTETTNSVQAFLQGENTPTDGLGLFYNGSQIPGTSTAANPTCMAPGDTIRLVYSQRVNVITVVYDNYTQNKHNSLTYTDPMTAGTHYEPNSSKFAIWNLGGSYTILNMKVTSRQPPNPRVAFLGDSKTYGFNSVTVDQRFGSLMKQFGPTAVYAGQADITTDLLADLPYILASPPKYAVLCIGYNDVGFAVPIATTEANYAAIVAALQAAGVTVINMLSIPANAGVNVTALNAYINANYSNVVDPSVGWSNSLYLSSDNVHPNAPGHAFVASRIESYNYIPLAAVAAPAAMTFSSFVTYPPSSGQCISDCSFFGTTNLANSGTSTALEISTPSSIGITEFNATIPANSYLLNELGVSNTAHNVFYSIWRNTTHPYASFETYSEGDPINIAGSQQWLAGPTYIGNANANGGATLPSGCTGLSVGTANQTCIDLTGDYFGPSSAPAGACFVNGAWAFSQDGHATFCASGTWVTKI